MASAGALAVLVAATAAAQDAPKGDGGASSHVATEKTGLGCAGGGGRLAKCTESVRVTTEREVSVSVRVPALPTKACQATLTTAYEQRNTVARVQGTIETADCAACSGDYTIVVRVRDESGETQSLEFSGSWQRADDKPVTFTTDYPIGENVDLVAVRSTGLRCACADASSASAVEK